MASRIRRLPGRKGLFYRRKGGPYRFNGKRYSKVNPYLRSLR